MKMCKLKNEIKVHNEDLQIEELNQGAQLRCSSKKLGKWNQDSKRKKNKKKIRT